MSSAAKLAAALMTGRPKGTPYADYTLGIARAQGITTAIAADVQDAVYAAALSYSEALRGLGARNTTWALVKLYYSAFYSLRASLLLDDIIPFFCGEFYLCDARTGAVQKGGRSSHNWHWKSVRSYQRLSGWYYSDDSNNAYDQLRDMREEVSYRAGFSDPSWPNYLYQASMYGVAKSFRTYRDDNGFFYTYLADHLAMAYPTKLLLEVCSRYAAGEQRLEEEQSEHLHKVWPLKDRPPLI